MTETPQELRGPGCLRTAAQLGCGLAVVAVVVLGLLYWQVASSLNRPLPKAAVAPLSWTSVDVQLSRAHPTAHGTLTVTTHGKWQPYDTIGVGAGTPQRALAVPSGDVAAMLTGPVIRLSAQRGGTASGACIAACELTLPNVCTADCMTTYDVILELVQPATGQEPVSVRLSGGASLTIGEQAPDVQFVVEGGSPIPATPQPVPSGGR